MEINSIITIREYEKRPSFDLVYEWEDEMSKCLDIPLKSVTNGTKLAMLLPMMNRLLLPNLSFMYHMSPYIGRLQLWNRHNVIPCLIDFFLKKEEDLNSFYKSYSKHKIVFISSYEVYLYLKSVNCPLNIAHLPLSLSDKYIIKDNTKYDKQFDLIMMGRQSPVLKEFVTKYAQSHPNFYYVYKPEGNPHYISNRGEDFGDARSREDYMLLMRKARVGLYSTPGTDHERNTSGFSQVTPRFLELIANGCHIISRYSSNPDTDFFEMSKICKHTDNYDSFEQQMSEYLSQPVDMQLYSRYLAHHYTSTRAKQLQKVVNFL